MEYETTPFVSGVLRGMAMNASINKYFSYLVLLIIATALAPTLFTYANLTGTANVPGWVTVITPILVGVFFVLMLWKSS